MSFGAPGDGMPEVTSKKPKKIKVGDRFYVRPGMYTPPKLKLQDGDTLTVESIISPKEIRYSARSSQADIGGNPRKISKSRT